MVGESIGGVLALTAAATVPDRINRVIALNPYDHGDKFGGGIRNSRYGWLIGSFAVFGRYTPETPRMLRAILSGGLADPASWSDPPGCPRWSAAWTCPIRSAPSPPPSTRRRPTGQCRPARAPRRPPGRRPGTPAACRGRSPRSPVLRRSFMIGSVSCRDGGLAGSGPAARLMRPSAGPEAPCATSTSWPVPKCSLTASATAARSPAWLAAVYGQPVGLSERPQPRALDFLGHGLPPAAAGSCPRTATCPAVRCWKPSRISTVVVLPAPFGPRKAKISPAVPRDRCPRPPRGGRSA